MISSRSAGTGQVGTAGGGGRAHSPAQISRIPFIGTWLMICSDFFFFVVLYFSFFYLQQANINHMWQPKGIHPPNLALGTATAFVVVIGVLVGQWGLPRLRHQATLASFRNIGWAGVAVMIAGVVIGIWQLSHVGYGISSGAYSSIFFTMQTVVLVQVVIMLLWLLSLANRAAYEAAHPIAMPAPDTDEEVATPIAALAYSYQVGSFFLGGVVLLSWVVCYFL